MTTHPYQPPAEWESPPQERLARDGQRPAWTAGEWPGCARPSHGADPSDGYLSDHPSMPGYPPLSDHPSMPGYPPLSDHPSMPGYPPLSDHPSMPGYPPGYPSLPDYPPGESWPGPGHPAGSHVDHDDYVHPRDAAAPVATASPAPTTTIPAATQAAPLLPVRPHPAFDGRSGPPPFMPAPPMRDHVPGPPVLEPAPAPAGRPGRRARSRARPVTSEDAHWAMLAYLTVPIFGCVVPLAIYLLSLRGSRWLRAHASQALNVWLTWLLYNISALLAGGLLALDSTRVALAVVMPLVAVLWLSTLGYLIRAGRLASQGREYAIPRWLCSRLVR